MSELGHPTAPSPMCRRDLDVTCPTAYVRLRPEGTATRIARSSSGEWVCDSEGELPIRADPTALALERERDAAGARANATPKRACISGTTSPPGDAVSGPSWPSSCWWIVGETRDKSLGQHDIVVFSMPWARRLYSYAPFKGHVSDRDPARREYYLARAHAQPQGPIAYLRSRVLTALFSSESKGLTSRCVRLHRAGRA